MLSNDLLISNKNLSNILFIKFNPIYTQVEQRKLYAPD